MAQTQYYAYAGEVRDPRTAAILSMLPGLGQFYNGESRKGFLFLDVAIINYLLLGIILLAPGIAKLMQEIGLQFGMRVNHGVLEALKQMQFGSPVSLVVCGMVLAFVAYAARDAYDHARIRRRQALYKDSVIELTEATSGSYIFHASIIMALAVMALFFCIPNQPARQVTEIMFLDSVIRDIKQKPVVKNILSPQDSQARIKKFVETNPIQRVPPKSDLSKLQSQNSHKQAESTNPARSSSSSSAEAAKPPAASRETAKPVLIAHLPTQALPAKLLAPVTPLSASMPRSSATPVAPLQMKSATTPAAPTTPSCLPGWKQKLSASNLIPRVLPVPTAGSAIPMPIMTSPGTCTSAPQQLLSQFAAGSLPHSGNAQAIMPSSSTAPSGGLKNAVDLPTTGSIPQLGNGPAFTPHTGSGGSRSGAPSNSGTPGLVNIATHKPGSGFDSGLVPQAMGMQHGTQDGTGITGGSDSGPAPVRAGHGRNGDGPIRIVPQVSGPGGKAQSGPANDPLNFRGAKPANSDTGESYADPDYSLYMANLQRRIKRAWSPPKDLESKKVKVMFKIHAGGELSNLRITSRSGSLVADEAALKAVETAAPFSHLPERSPENVDIEFTFDYNVFNSRNF